MLNRAFSIGGQVDRLKGALRSGSSAARLGMFLKALGPFTRLLDKMIYGALYGNEGKEEKLSTCLMIVGPPRSGSTIIYQVLARAIPCVYISNLHPLFPNCASSYMLRNGLFGVNLVGFHNYYGYTSSIYDVNEGNEIVGTFFRGNANKELIRERFIKSASAIGTTQERPLIFKNLKAYSHISRLHEAVPEIVFLRVKRDPEQVIKSVVRAYHELGTFHPVPKALVNCEINDPVEFAVRQILEIERVIDLQIEQIQKPARLEWWYEDFCSAPWPMIKNLAENYLKMDPSLLRRDAVPELQISKHLKVSTDEAYRISLLLQQYTNNNVGQQS